MKNTEKIPIRIRPMVLAGTSGEEISRVSNSGFLGSHICLCNLTDGSVDAHYRGFI